MPAPMLRRPSLTLPMQWKGLPINCSREERAECLIDLDDVMLSWMPGTVGVREPGLEGP
jgi:hypothetical protein